jgi:hypothetical protein
MRDLTERCGWCGSTDVEAEYVDNGVGYQQVSPHVCSTCHAVEISPYNEDPITPEEKTRNYHTGEYSEELRAAWPFNWDVAERRRLGPWAVSANTGSEVWIDGVIHRADIRHNRVFLCCRDLEQGEHYYETGGQPVSCLACLLCSHKEYT